jgi:hypothetical protein
MHSDNALRVDGFYTLPIRIGDNEQGIVRSQLGEVLAELNQHDPLMTALTGDVGIGPIFASKELRQLKECTELNCSNIDDFLQLVRNGRFRGLLIVILVMHEKRNIEHSPLTPFIKQLINTNPHSAILKDWPLTSLRALSFEINRSTDAQMRIIRIDPGEYLVSSWQSVFSDQELLGNDEQLWPTTWKPETLRTGIRSFFADCSAFLREGFPAVATETDPPPVDTFYLQQIANWVTTEASPWSSKSVKQLLKNIVDEHAYELNERLESTITILSLLRIARWLAVQNLEGTPLSTTFFGYPNWEHEGKSWEQLFTHANRGSIRAIMRRRSLKQLVSVAYRHEIKKLAELVVDCRAFLKVDLFLGQIIGICEDHLTLETSRFDRFRQLTEFGGLIVHARPEGYVEVYSGGDFALWFDGFDWHTQPFAILNSVCEQFLKSEKIKDSGILSISRRLSHVVADLLDNQRSSILVLTPSKIHDKILGGLNNNPLEDSDSADFVSCFSRMRKETTHLDLSDVHLSHVSTFRTLLSMDGAHLISFQNGLVEGNAQLTSEIGLLYSAKRKGEDAADSKTKAGSGTEAAIAISRLIRGGYVLKISGSGDLKIFLSGQRLWSPDPNDWPQDV